MLTQDAFDKKFPTEEACRDYLVAMRWPKGIQCPRCGESQRVYKLKKVYHWVCKNPATYAETGLPVCGGKNGYRFSVLTGTIFQDTKKPLKIWFKVGYLMLVAKKGISALQVHRVIFGEDSGSDYRTSWYMCHRWRAAMRGDALKLKGIVEIDETYVGGKEGNKHVGKRVNKGHQGKVGVIGAISRKGNVVCEVIENLSHGTIDDFVKKTISKKVEIVATDQLNLYAYINYGPDAQHGSVDHGRDEYVRGVVHTGNIDSFWSLVKRGIMGQFHHVSKKYLPLYLNEFSFRHNQRKAIDPFGTMLQTCGA